VTSICRRSGTIGSSSPDSRPTSAWSGGIDEHVSLYLAQRGVHRHHAVVLEAHSRHLDVGQQCYARNLVKYAEMLADDRH
jgi:tRNA U34 2-thiouridine synthase MnmA/TrmU